MTYWPLVISCSDKYSCMEWWLTCILDIEYWIICQKGFQLLDCIAYSMRITILLVQTVDIGIDLSFTPTCPLLLLCSIRLCIHRLFPCGVFPCGIVTGSDLEQDHNVVKLCSHVHHHHLIWSQRHKGTCHKRTVYGYRISKISKAPMLLPMHLFDYS